MMLELQIALLVGIFGIVATLIGLAVLRTFFTVDQQQVAIIERFGKFVRTAGPGLNTRFRNFDRIVGYVNLRVQLLDVKVETLTKDKYFVHVTVSVQYQVFKGKEFEAFYKLELPERHMNALVYNAVRARVPELHLEELFQKKAEIADAIKNDLDHRMPELGYAILDSLVTDIELVESVKAAMNEVNAAKSLRAAAEERGEADKILRVKQAEAEAQAKALQGKGMADERREIIEGLQESVAHFQEGVVGASPHDVMTLVMLTQYFDMLAQLGRSGTNTIMIPHSPGTLNDLADQIRNAMIIAGETRAGSAPHRPREAGNSQGKPA